MTSRPWIWACASVVAIAHVSRAQTRYFSPVNVSTGTWNDSNNWFSDSCGTTPAGVPTANNEVEICSGKTARILDTTAVAKRIAANAGTIKIEPDSSHDATLTLGSGTVGLASNMGTLQLLNAG